MNSAALNKSTEPVDAQVNGNLLGVAEPIRLNLGGRTHKIQGFLTVDKFGGKEVDCAADVSALPYENHSVSEIYASHVLEHFPHVRTQYVLEEWHRVLSPSGKLYISVPDFDAVIRLYNLRGTYDDYLRNLMYGDQGYDLAYHYTIFTFATLSALCMKAGFEDAKRIEKMPYGLTDCSTNQDTITKTQISVNVEVTA